MTSGTSITAEQVITENITAPSDQQVWYTTYIFEALVIAIGVIGCFANALVLFAILMSKQNKNRAFNELLVNQMSLDLFSCIWLIVSYSFLILENIKPIGYWPCMLFANENLLWCGIYGSKVNLMSVSVERYVMIVHPIWHRNNAKSWMIHTAVCASWLIGFVSSIPASFVYTTYYDGQCLISTVYTATWTVLGAIIYGVTIFIIFFVAVLCSFLFCYGSILIVIRRQTRTVNVQQADSQPVTAKAMQETRIERNTIKTMIIVSVAFVICWLPCDLYLAIAYSNPTLFIGEIYQTFLFMAMCNICLNPFIYAAKYEVVRKKLIKWIKCDDSTMEDNHTMITVQTNT